MCVEEGGGVQGRAGKGLWTVVCQCVYVFLTGHSCLTSLEFVCLFPSSHVKAVCFLLLMDVK